MNKYKPYLEYTSTGIDWLGDIPSGWRVGGLTKFLDSIVDYRGKTPEKVDEGVFLVTARNIKEGNINYELSHEYIKINEYETVMRRGKPKIGDVLFTTEAPLGEVANVDREDIALAQRVIKFRALPEHLDNYYLKYWILSHPFQSNLKTFATGSTAEGIKASKLSSLQVILPTIAEQIKIVGFLNKKITEINYLVQNKYRLIDLLEQQRQSIITEAVTKGLNPNVKMKDSGVEWIGEIPEHWEIKKVKHFANHVGSGKTPSGGSEVYLDEGVPFLRSLNVHFDGIRLKDLAFISEETNAEMKSSQVKPLDILLNITGASIGRTAIVPKDFGRANVNQHVCIIRLNQRRVYPFYFNMLMSSDVINQQIWFAQNGSSREGLNFVQVKELIFAIPPTLEEQRDINKWVFNKQKAIFNLTSTVKEQIEKLKEYRQSLIYEAVTGKIDIRDMELDEVR